MSGERFTVEPNTGTHFAWLNTRQALERTYMAWIRTSVSLISFGFTIVQFFQRLVQAPTAAARPLNPGAPRILGLALIGVGLLGLIISSWQYRIGVKYMWQPQFRAVAGIQERPLRSPAVLAAAVLMLIGLFAFLSVFVRLT